MALATQPNKIDALYKECAQIRCRENRAAVDLLIAQGEQNANDTVRDGAAPPSDWERIAIQSIASILAFDCNNRHVATWFARRGVAA